LDPDPDPYWPPSGSTGSGSGSVKNEYGSETLIRGIKNDKSADCFHSPGHPVENKIQGESKTINPLTGFLLLVTLQKIKIRVG
jgi:hypothetical protein